MEETVLAYSTMPQTIQTLGNYTFLVCINNENIARCSYLNETTMHDNHIEWNITGGCHLVYNCSQMVVYNRMRITIVNYQQKCYFSSDAQFDFELNQDHMDKFVKTIIEIDAAAEHNEKRLQSIHQTPLNQDKVLGHSTAELYNMGAYSEQTPTFVRTGIGIEKKVAYGTN